MVEIVLFDCGYADQVVMKSRIFIPSAVFLGALAGVALSILIAYRNEPTCFQQEPSIVPIESSHIADIPQPRDCDDLFAE